MKDPYQVLGVNRESSDEEIKKAYRELARKYHPDRYANNPDFAEIANEKMQEINAAYDAINAERAGKGPAGSSSGGSYGNTYSYGNQGYGGAYGNPGSTSQNRNQKYQKIRTMINSGDLFGAEQELESFHEGDRGAEWNYLFACILVKKGNYTDAGYYFDRACSMDPYNQEYNTARRNFMQRMNGGSMYTGNGGGCSICDICQILICMDCCCNSGGC